MKRLFTLLCLFIITTCSAENGLFDFLNNSNNKASSVLLIFYRDNCPFCQNMNTTLQQDEKFTSLLQQKFKIQRIDINSEEGRALADRFDVHAVPTLIRYNIQNNDQQFIKGFPGINKLSALLDIEYSSKVKVNIQVNNSLACGDGIINAGETCDDNNITSGDGCSSTCQVETGYSCFGSPSVCTSTCGDGIVAPGVEQCDDGNITNGDGCNSVCTIEPGYICSGNPSVCTPAPPANDNCSSAITLAAISGTQPGDNTIATNSAGVANPGCQSLWQKDMWYKFTLTGGRPVSIAVNGVSMTDPIVAVYSGSCGSLAEVGCDDDAGPGNFSLWTGNLSSGTYYIRVLGYGSGIGGTGTFNLVYNFNTATCGNNILEFGEECDDGGVTNGDGCSSTCTFENGGAIKGVAVNEDATRSNPSAMLDVKSDAKGVLIPRLSSSQRSAITSPAKGLIVFDITSNSFWYYTGAGWKEISTSINTGFGAFTLSSQSFSGQFAPTITGESYDDGNNFGLNIFTAPADGLYQFNAFGTFNFTATAAQTILSVLIENTVTSSQHGRNSVIIPAGFTGSVHLSVSASLKLAAGTPTGVRIMVDGTPGTQQLTFLRFNGYRVY